MRLFLCLVTPDEALRRFFGRGKDAVLPSDALKRGACARLAPQPTTVAWVPKGAPSLADMERFLLHRTRGAQTCVLLVDRTWEHLVAEIRDATFIMPFDPPGADVNPQNFFHRLLARTLRNFVQVFTKFQKGDEAKLLALPLHNFRSDELREIARLCREEPESGTLSEDIEKHLVVLRKSVRPRRRSSFNTTYAVDDAKRFFAYGHERHAQFDTGAPHRPSCEVAGLFRFGVRLDERRHYNVSKSEGDRTHISGDFPDCHGTVHRVADRSHLNMFSNDFF